jgi:hypothetical protein
MIIIGHIGTLVYICILSICLFFFRYTGKTISAINLGSYNYLGFAERTGPCATDAINGIKSYAIANCSARIEIGMNVCSDVV